MIRYIVFLSLCLVPLTVSAEWLNRGYVKYGYSHFDFPSHSIVAQLGDEQQTYQRFSTRLMTEKSLADFTAAAHYDLQYTFAHQYVALSNSLESDPGNLFDLTKFIVDESKQTLMHRLDRLYVHYRGEQFALKAGRQAVTWGHGLMFQVMDIFNPFSPVALDTDYKSGNDMLYGEWLTPWGSDLQGLYVPRKSVEDELSLDSSATAVKYHGMFSDADYDILVARNNTIELAGFGIAMPLRESMWRLDLIANRLDDGDVSYSVVSNLDYSWTWFGYNIYGFIEYLYDSQGERTQGELMLNDNHYSALSLRIELHPLVNFSPSIISNVTDNSGLFYLSLLYDWMQDFNLSSSVIIPYGSESSEFGGLFSPGTSVRILLSAYF